MKKAVALALTLLTLATATSRADDEPQERLGEARKLLWMHRHQSTFIERALLSPLHKDRNRVIYRVRPRQTDRAIDIFLQDHYVMFNKGVRPNGKLFIYFPGTFGMPMLDQLLLNEAALKGFKALSLEYPNATDLPDYSAVLDLCSADPDPNCAEHVRRERLYGEDLSRHVSVNVANSAMNRLYKLMNWLMAHHPEDGWAEFINAKSDDLEWSKIVLGGHSQGAGMAAYLAKIHLVSRVALMSGPDDDIISLKGAAPWVSRSGATPQDRYYAMTHRREWTRNAIDTCLTAMGLGTDWLMVTDFTQNPAVESHHFMVDLEPQRLLPVGDSYHVSMESDPITPRLPDGTPAYRHVWGALLGN